MEGLGEENDDMKKKKIRKIMKRVKNPKEIQKRSRRKGGNKVKNSRMKKRRVGKD